MPSKSWREICLFTRMFQMFTKLNRDEGRRKCVCLCCNLFLSGWFCVYDRYHGWQLFVTLIFILGNVYGLIYHRTKGERAGVLCASQWYSWMKEIIIWQIHISSLSSETYTCIYSPGCKRRAGLAINTPPPFLALSVSVCLQVRRSHLELWVLLQNIAGFHRQGSKVSLFPAGSCFSTLKYIMRYNFYKRAWIICAALHSFLGLCTPSDWAEWEISISIKRLFMRDPKPPLLLTPSLASSLKLGIHRRFIWEAALSVRTTGLGKSIRPRWMDSTEAFRHSKIQTSPGSFLTRSQHNWVCSQSARTKPAVAHTKLSLPQCCSPLLSLFAVSLEVLCQH